MRQTGDERPEGKSEDRRRFLQRLGASMALAGAGAGCTRQPPEHVVAAADAPERRIPGRPVFYASALATGGAGLGVLVECHGGRPTKVEGNPDHPSSLGATDAFAQAALLDLYDDRRATGVTRHGRDVGRDAFRAAWQQDLAERLARRGAGLRVLSRTILSPTLAAARARLLDRFPAARWHQYEPLHRDLERAATQLAFGQEVTVLPRFAAADVVLSLGGRFLDHGPGWVRHARDFASRRRPGAPGGMSRVFAVEDEPTRTGAAADHRLPLDPCRLDGFARAVARRFGMDVAAGCAPAGAAALLLENVVRALEAHRGRALVVAGAQESVAVQAIAHALNERLGNAGTTLDVVRPVQPVPEDHAASLRELVDALQAGEVDALVVLDANPAYETPAALGFAAAAERAAFRVHAGAAPDETADLCEWHLPLAHPFESWGDLVGHDGTVAVVQPMIAPLFEALEDHVVIDLLAGSQPVPARARVAERWRPHAGDVAFDSAWHDWLRRGRIDGTAAPAVPLRASVEPALPAPPAPEPLVLRFVPDPTVGDGRSCGNAWLQELPKPFSTLTWENAVAVAPADARRFGVTDGDVIRVTAAEGALEGPVHVAAGQAQGVVVVSLGYGRRRAGAVGTGLGHDAYALRPASSAWTTGGIRVERTGGRAALAKTQHHHRMEGRHPVRSVTAARPIVEPGRPGADLMPDRPAGPHAWGMVIDLSTCIGCGVCTIACQAENNVPPVGKEEVLRGREMHWIRVDHYFEGTADDPRILHQPVPCMHCEKAPCETVCPVYATLHDEEGLNEMVYNRCIGTRYCSNNCPYKVRRFNFFRYADHDSELLALLRNPDVTVRSGGVMEKCTYCVQRIQEARIHAKVQGVPFTGRNVVAACQAACPTGAIAFGDLLDAGSEVLRRRGEPRHYALLEELNTQPRTTYLAHVANQSAGEDG